MNAPPSRRHLPLAQHAELSRRDFLLGASAALAAGSGCVPPREKIVPYVRSPPELQPGIALEFATSIVLDGYATGLLVRSHEGRPTKVEGNPAHPASLGASSALDQASVLQLYDPDRLRAPAERGLPAAYSDIVTALRRQPAAGLRVLLEPQSSPALGEQLARIALRFPGTKLTFYSPGAPPHATTGHEWLYGEALGAQYDFTSARTVLALDADFLASMPFSLRWARDFADGRRLPSPTAAMNRLYVAEACLTPTGMLADHRLPARSSEILAIAAALLTELGRSGRASGLPASVLLPLAQRVQAEPVRRFVQGVARDLAQSGPNGVVIAGAHQPPEVHALVQLCNEALGSVGTSVSFTPPALLGAGLPTQPLAALIDEMRAGAVETLLIVEGNPVYTAPADSGFLAALHRVPTSVCLSLYAHETAQACRYLVPAAHYLEAWGDARAYDGTLSFVQPLIAPMFGGRTALELLADLEQPAAITSGYTLLRAHHARAMGARDFATDWERHLQRGFVANSTSAAVKATVRTSQLAAALERAATRERPAAYEVRLPLSPAVYDGRFANNAWLQELPDPVTKLTWDNAALISPATAAQLGVETEQWIEIKAGPRTLHAPVLIEPGHADACVTLQLGYGRSGSEKVARGVGVNGYALRTQAADYVVAATLAAGEGRHALARTQLDFDMQARPIAFAASLDAYRAHPDFTRHARELPPSLMPERRWEGLQWAMTIDTTVCTGCNACVVACQAENNVPVVGKEGVQRGRAMHWLRIDRYHVPGEGARGHVNQPMLCQHCEHAPCEYPCPVNATVHSPDGLNEMVYNRCVGTRFCSNNCPYKVRRFNWFDYQDHELTQLQRNPDVTVRARGVMEKCTYCVQRIRGAEIAGRLEHRDLRGDEVVTACQQACPTQAITFGSLSNPTLAVVTTRDQPRAYAVLNELGTRPRTHYLAKIVNLNPELERDV